jgi:MbtH protein
LRQLPTPLTSRYAADYRDTAHNGGTVPASESEDAENEDATIYLVVINAEEQYSLWPNDRPIPLGWRPVGKQGGKAECLKYIDEVWTDMRPRRLRTRKEGAGK